jgi:ribosomal-protein-alanine N-acetyltransferase
MCRNLGHPLVAGSRVFLRQPREDDMDEFIRLVVASRCFLHPWVTPASTPEAYARFLLHSRRKSMCARLVCRSENGRIIGVCNLSQIFLGNLKSAYLGYWIGASFADQGYMTEAVYLVLTYAFVSLRLQRIEANIQPENAGSRALVARIGFKMAGFSSRYLKVAGRWKDHERWVVRREEWSERIRERGSLGPNALAGDE